MTNAPFGPTERDHTGYSCCQCRQSMHDERQEEGERKAIDHTVVPFKQLSPLSQRAMGSHPSAKSRMFTAHRGKGNIHHARTASPGEYKGGADVGEVKFIVIRA